MIKHPNMEYLNKRDVIEMYYSILNFILNQQHRDTDHQLVFITFSPFDLNENSIKSYEIV